MLLLMLSIGCIEPLVSNVTLTGTLTQTNDSNSDPVSDGEVATYDGLGQEVDCTVASDLGEFSVSAPASSTFFVQTAGADRVRTTFTGWSGIDDIDIDPGVLWVRSADELDEIRGEFSECDRASLPGGIIEGEVRVYLPVEEPTDDLPLVSTAQASVEDQEGETIEACYLDDEGLSSPDTEQTGDSGRFAIFGLEPGLTWLTVTYAVTDDLEESSEYPILLPENGTAPLYPVLVDLP